MEADDLMCRTLKEEPKGKEEEQMPSSVSPGIRYTAINKLKLA